MAGLRLLRFVFVLGLACTSVGCALGPIYARRVEGEVLDEQTREPVANALVFAVYEMVWMEERYPVDTRWTRTDAQGHFAIPGHFSMRLGPPLSWTDREYFVTARHPRYGVFTLMADDKVASWPHPRFVFELEPNSLRWLFEHSGEWATLCSGLGNAGCDEMCSYAYGSVEACYAHGRPRPR